MLGRLQIPFDERAIDDEFGGLVCKLLLAPLLRLPAHGLEVALHAVDADGEAVLQREVLGMLGQDRSERARDNVTILRRLCFNLRLPLSDSFSAYSLACAPPAELRPPNGMSVG
jgi:hypothetical protein